MATIGQTVAGFASDLRYSARALRRSWGFTAAVVGTLALGLGTNAAILSFLDQLLFRGPSGVATVESLRRVWLEQRVGISKEPYFANAISYHSYRALSNALGRRVQLALYHTQRDVPIGRGDAAQTATVSYATASYFTALGIRPGIGRWFGNDEADIHAARPVAVISDAYWRTHFGGDANVIGQPITIDNRPYTVVGVAGPGFSGIDLDETQIWIPLGMYPTRDVARVGFWDSSIITFTIFARVSGTSDALMEQAATAAYQRAPVTDFAPDPADRIRFASIVDARGPGPRLREASIGLRLALVAALVLLITVANVLNLLLARAVSRSREIAVRLALGISRIRLARLMIIECVLLSLAAGTAAILSAFATGSILRSQLLPGVHFAASPVSGFVVVVIAATSCVTGLAIGGITAKRASRPDLTLALKAGAPGSGRERSTITHVLVGAQAALAVTLLFTATLLVFSLLNIERLKIGFDADRLAYVSVALPPGQRPDTEAFSSAMRAAGQRVQAVPGVEAVAFGRNEPIGVFGRVKLYSSADSSEKPGLPLPTASYVSADYFRAAGLRTIRGHTFSDDASGSTAVVVNALLARTFWPKQDPVGQCLHVQNRAEPCLYVGAVVDNTMRDQLTDEPAPQIYLPIFGSTRGRRPPVVMMIRAAPDRLGAALIQASRILHDAFPRGTPAFTRMDDRLSALLRPWRLGAGLFMTFGMLSLLVATIGIYSSVSYTVTQRTHEFGVRIALGARARDILLLVTRRSLQPVVVGCLAGGIMGVAAARVVQSLLYGVSVTSLPALLGAGLVLLASAAVAALVPGWRAAHVDPIRTMAAD